MTPALGYKNEKKNRKYLCGIEQQIVKKCKLRQNLYHE